MVNFHIALGAIFFMAEVQGQHQPNILFASDDRWSDVNGEDNLLKEGLERHDFQVTVMSGFTTGTLSTRLDGYRLFAYPEAENGAMSSFFSDNDYAALSKFVYTGNHWVSFTHRDSINMMNGMFVWEIEHLDNSCYHTARKVSNILDGPDELVALSITHAVRTVSLPPEAICVYATGDCCFVFRAVVGNGYVSFLGWDWHFNPLAAAEDWNEVAALMLNSVIATSSPTVLPSLQPSALPSEEPSVSPTNPTQYPTPTNPSQHPTSSPLISKPYHHCPIDRHYSSNCDDHAIMPGTNCKIWFNCPENKYPEPVWQTCLENSEWSGNDPKPQCYFDPCPVIEGFQMFQTGGCEGRNELGTTFDSIDVCAKRCEDNDACVSFEIAKREWENHVEANRCAISTTCTYDESRKLLNSDTCLYVKGLDNGSDSLNGDGQITHHTHCPFEGDLEFFASSCDNVILEGTKCDFWYNCKEHEHSIKSTLVCMADGKWEGEVLENGLMWDSNCYPEMNTSEETNTSDPPSGVTTPPKKDSPPEEGTCLVYDSAISLADGTTEPIHSLQVGTNVALGNDAYSAIVFFSHYDKLPEMRHVVTIKTQETNITATPNHLIFSSEIQEVTLRNLRAFEEVKVGDFVLMDSEKGPVSTKVIDIIHHRMWTRVFNPVPKSGYLIANNIFVASGVAFGILPHLLQYPVVHAVSMLICGISERVCQIEENHTKPYWVRLFQGWITAMGINRGPSRIPTATPSVLPSGISSEEPGLLPTSSTKHATLINPPQLASEISSYHCLKNDSCANHLDTGLLESASREANVLTGIYNSVNELVPQEKFQYDRTMAQRCCEISECEAKCCEQGNTTTIEATSCRRIEYEGEPQSDKELATLNCPPTVLKRIIDADVLFGVQQVHKIECCDLVQVARPSTSCMTVHKELPDGDQSISRMP